MRRSEARLEIESMMCGLQKTRSIFAEVGLPETILAEMYPWIWGDKCPLALLSRMVDDDFTPMEWFNIRTVFYHFMEATALEVSLYHQGKTDKGFPIGPPSMDVLKGWEEERE